MAKKYITIDNVKHFIEDDGPEDNETAEETTEETTEETVEEEATKAAKLIGATLRKELGIDAMKSQINKVESYMEQPENSKLKKLLNGKDFIKDADQLTREEKIVGFFHGLVTNNHTILKALSETSADGGYLFPAEFLAELVRPLAQPGTMRSLVRVIPMKRNVLNAASLLNRPKIYWTAENATKTTTTAQFGQPSITAYKAAAIIYSSDELIEDSTEFDVVQLIITLFSEAIVEEEDRCILRGNGTTAPTGIVTARSAGTIASVTCSGNLSFDNILELIYALKTKYRKGASFLVHPTNVKELRKMKDSDGRYLWQDPSTPEGYPRIYGYPVYEFYDMPESEIEFGDWKLAYWLGDRQKMTVKISQDTTQAFTQDMTAIRVVIRLGGGVVLGEAAKALISIP
jgi:HK97 family phage major capsid protein